MLKSVGVASGNLSSAVLKVETKSPSESLGIELAPSEALSVRLAATKAGNKPVKPSKEEIRSSLRASTLDSIFSTVFSCITAEVLLSNFLLELGATSVEIGFLLAIPMLANFLQPLGAYLAEKSTSRRRYSVRLFAVARLLWLVLVLGILGFNPDLGAAHRLVQWTLFVSLGTHLLGAMGSASWMSWMAALVPERLRGRYFGLRNSVASLTNLLCIPLLGLIVSRWSGGAVRAYGILLIVAVLAGIVSLSCQLFMKDVNPQVALNTSSKQLTPLSTVVSLLKETNFLKFLLYFGLWMFAINLSAPFFNIYLLQDLGLDVSWVTFYSSLTAGANVVMLMLWGKLSDRIGNRPILVAVGILVAAVPLLWLGVGTNSLSLLLGVPLLYMLAGGTWSAIELCNNNLPMAIAPAHGSSNYFAIAAAVGGLGGALGTTTGGILADASPLGLPGLFAFSAVVRLIALLPLCFVQEPRSATLSHWLSRWLRLPILKPSFSTKPALSTPLK